MATACSSNRSGRQHRIELIRWAGCTTGIIADLCSVSLRGVDRRWARKPGSGG